MIKLKFITYYFYTEIGTTIHRYFYTLDDHIIKIAIYPALGNSMWKASVYSNSGDILTEDMIINNSWWQQQLGKETLLTSVDIKEALFRLGYTVSSSMYNKYTRRQL